MPEHFHWLIGEPEIGDRSVVRKVVKERFSRPVQAKERVGQGGRPLPQELKPVYKVG
jgi:hypothetical protein